MRLALVIKNPKWELFTKASDEFKALTLKDSDSAVLVERGRAKERRSSKDKPACRKSEPDSQEALAADLRKLGKTPDQIEKAVAASKLPSISKAAKKVAAIVAIACITLSGFAQQNITAMLPATTLAGSSTNAGPGGGLLGWGVDKIAVLQASIIQTNVAHATTLSNAFIRFDTSDNGTDWQISAYSYSLAPSGVTNDATGFSTTSTTITRITNTIGGKWLRVGIMENVNTNRIFWSRFTWSIKE